MTKDEALLLALEYLEASDNYLGSLDHSEPIAAIKEALAQPEQEPVCDKDPQGCWNVRCQLGKKCKNTPPAAQPEQEPEELTIAYMDGYDKGKAAAQRTWVGLTDEEAIDIGTQCQWYDGDCERFDSIGFARAIEVKLKQKNS